MEFSSFKFHEGEELMAEGDIRSGE